MTKRQALKRAEDIFSYIERKSGYTGATRDMKHIILKELMLVIRINGEVCQGYIESLVRIFTHIKEKRNLRDARSTAMKTDSPA